MLAEVFISSYYDIGVFFQFTYHACACVSHYRRLHFASSRSYLPAIHS